MEMTTEKKTESVMTRPIAEIEEELRRAKAAEAEAVKLAEIELRNRERQAEVEKTTAYMRELHSGLIAANVQATLRESRVGDYGSMYLASIDLEGMSWRIELERRGGGYSEKSYQINVGSYGNRKIYPRLKTDTFKYDAIVGDVKARVERAKRESELSAEREQNRKASREIVGRLLEEFKLPEHRLISDCDTDATKVKFELKTTVTEDQARAILQAMADAGVNQ